jgi:hypothetical protein
MISGACSNVRTNVRPAAHPHLRSWTGETSLVTINPVIVILLFHFWREIMHFKFAGVDPLSTGCAPTEEKREEIIKQMMPSSFSDIVDWCGKNDVLVIMKGPADNDAVRAFSWKSAIEWFKNLLEDHQLIVMRRRLVGYEWRIYLISKPNVLLYATTAEEYKEATQNGYEVYVVSMGTRLAGGHSISYPIQWPFLRYVEIAELAETTWNAYMEKQSVPTPAH